MQGDEIGGVWMVRSIFGFFRKFLLSRYVDMWLFFSFFLSPPRPLPIQLTTNDTKSPREREGGG